MVGVGAAFDPSGWVWQTSKQLSLMHHIPGSSRHDRKGHTACSGNVHIAFSVTSTALSCCWLLCAQCLYLYGHAAMLVLNTLRGFSGIVCALQVHFGPTGRSAAAQAESSYMKGRCFASQQQQQLNLKRLGGAANLSSAHVAWMHKGG